ncbi:MAG: peptidase U35 [Devosia sp. 67-54]|uniref:HK97 family phage prohead protease n=1 Tax=unclassified Devosia TaxID=196773 RepID=UPI000868A9DB|nr:MULTISPECIES: HK97 family phage prohead protease [unclassified Devosia]MBN9305640.1 HK97 family phage prohead protease [Devosia sp.]ODU62669.1 MAG: peptidase U35 [Pelagibacterium sp. SCN 68-10]OJX19205.1 MAG: peptidase U35 [Devosia sp. 67-54]
MQPIPIDAEGRFAGYASVFGEVDDGGDIVMPGAFRKSLGLRGRHRVKMLFQHDPKEPVGTWDKVAEDGFGLWVEGRLVGEVPRADALRRLIAKGAVDGLSIGFRTVKSTRDPRSGHRRLWEIDLWEISIVTFPMMDRARIAPGTAGGRKARLDRSLEAAISVFKH